MKMAEINFLCVHKKLRKHRLAPVLIKEVTRKVNLKKIWQAVYTAGIVLPKPIAQCTYWHRNLNVKKLIDIKFSALPQGQNINRYSKMYKLPSEPLTPGIRPMVKKDAK